MILNLENLINWLIFLCLTDINQFFLIWIFFSSLPGSSSYPCCLVAKLYLILCNHIDYSMPGFLVFYYLPEFAQTKVHWVGDAIQTSHPRHPLLLLPSIFPASESFPIELASILWYIYRLRYSTFYLFYISLFWGSGKISQLLIHHSMEVILFGNCWTIEEKQIKVK